jgi:aspartate 1-decarboxylase
VEVGHKLIVVAYCAVAEDDVRSHRPRVVLVHDDNSIRQVKDWEGAAIRVPTV